MIGEFRNNELLDAARFPRTDKFVEKPVQRLPAHPGTPGVDEGGFGVDAVLDGGSAENLESRGEVVGEPLDDDRVATKGEMWPMLLCGTDGNDESGVPVETRPDVSRRHPLEV